MNIYKKDVQNIAARNQLLRQLAGRTILLSGATGMIGKCIIDLLMQYNDDCPKEQQVRIIALSRNEESARQRLGEHWSKDTLRYVPCDVNVEVPECGRAEYIIHAASNTHPQQYSQDAVGTIASNVIGTKNLLDYAVSHQAERFCFLSSVEIYGENRGIQTDLKKIIWDILIVIRCGQDIQRASGLVKLCAMPMPRPIVWILSFRV